MRQHHNSGATSWASMPLADAAPNTVVKLKAQPDGYEIYVVAADEAKALPMLDVYLSANGVPFFPDAVQQWHARELGQNVMVGNAPWDRHPAYRGPDDTVVYVYSIMFERRKPAPVTPEPVATIIPPPPPTPAPPEPEVVEAPKPRARVKKVAAPTGQVVSTPRVSRPKKRV